jgi:hypothetical protein
MTGAEWIGVGGIIITGMTVATTIVLANRSQTNEFKTTIHNLFTSRMDRIESQMAEERHLADEWIQEIEDFGKETSGRVKILENRVDTVEKMCDRRHFERNLLRDSGV